MQNFFYRVKSGDTVNALSRRFGIPPHIIIKENGLSEEVNAGDILYLTPCEKTYEVDLKDDLNSIAEKFNISVDELKSINGGLSMVYYGLIIRVI